MSKSGRGSGDVATVLTEKHVLEALSGPADEVTTIDLSGRRITAIDENAFAKLTSLETVNLSDNRLRSIGNEFSTLTNLKALDLRDNCLTKPLTYLQSLPSSLIEINLSGNPLKDGDKMLAIELFPALEVIDGKKCAQNKELLKKMDTQIESKVELIWLNGRFSEQLRDATLTSTDVSEKINREVLRKAKADIKYNETFQVVLLHKLEKSIRRKVDDELKRVNVGRQRKFGQENTNSDENIAEDVKPLSTTTSPIKKPKRTKDSKTDKLKRVKKPKENSEIDYEAKLFLRCHCHQNNPLDSSTQIWKAAFKPTVPSKPDQPPTVATCGGNIVCLIDCDEAIVKQRYTDENIGENFYALAWTVLTENGNEDAVLAVAGLTKTIVLISTSQFKCYKKFHAHEKDINALLFHPTRTHWLFSGSYDQKIKIWNIQRTALEKIDYAPLIEVDTKNELLTFCYSAEYNCLLAGGESGLTVWQNVNLDLDQGTFGQLRFEGNSSPVVDGVAAIPESHEFIVVKQSRTGTIGIASMHEIMADLSKSNVRSKLNSFRQATLTNVMSLDYAVTKYDYIYPAIQSGLLVCGDDEGTIWLYDTRAMQLNSRENVQSSEKIAPTLTLPWPEISNPKIKARKVVDETKQVFINSMAVSPDLTFMVAATNINLVCIWKRT